MELLTHPGLLLICFLESMKRDVKPKLKSPFNIYGELNPSGMGSG